MSFNDLRELTALAKRSELAIGDVAHLRFGAYLSLAQKIKVPF